MKLTIKQSEEMGDWFVIERAEHDGRMWLAPIDGGMQLMCSSRISDADVEGTAAEMLSIAAAIDRRDSTTHKRCAVNARVEPVTFRSPRNSQRDGECSLAEADELAAEIRRVCVAPAVNNGAPRGAGGRE